ncbi:MAG: nucleotidyltransferase domain-containing protein [Deltaproteobacteria bacterium]|nr:nucleotidyltransferase domain-containing protein [Deltaproteobacteria bacterium]
MTEQVILYGSYAKGTARAFSDVDLVVISSDLAKWAPIERLQMLSRATINVDAPLEVLGYTPEEIAANGDDSIFWEEISKTGKEIYKKAA